MEKEITIKFIGERKVKISAQTEEELEEKIKYETSLVKLANLDFVKVLKPRYYLSFMLCLRMQYSPNRKLNEEEFEKYIEAINKNLDTVEDTDGNSVIEIDYDYNDYREENYEIVTITPYFNVEFESDTEKELDNLCDKKINELIEILSEVKDADGNKPFEVYEHDRYEEYFEDRAENDVYEEPDGDEDYDDDGYDDDYEDEEPDGE